MRLWMLTGMLHQKLECLQWYKSCCCVVFCYFEIMNLSAVELKHCCTLHRFAQTMQLVKERLYLISSGSLVANFHLKQDLELLEHSGR